MIYWAEREHQWMSTQFDRHHKHPWSVVIGGSVRVRCTTEEEADKIVSDMKDLYASLTRDAKRKT